MRSRAVIREAAEGMLRRLGADGPPVDVERLARHLGVRLGYEPLEGELSGLLFRGEARAIIGVNALQPRTRQRFAIAHELGHLALHEPGDRAHVDRVFALFCPDDEHARAPDASETEANAFAVELLLPAGMLGEDIAGRLVDLEDDESARRLANRYEVSPQVMAFRLAELGRASRVWRQRG